MWGNQSTGLGCSLDRMKTAPSQQSQSPCVTVVLIESKLSVCNYTHCVTITLDRPSVHLIINSEAHTSIHVVFSSQTLLHH